jgi:hypothetical protein
MGVFGDRSAVLIRSGPLDNHFSFITQISRSGDPAVSPKIWAVGGAQVVLNLAMWECLSFMVVCPKILPDLVYLASMIGDDSTVSPEVATVFLLLV